MGFKVIGRYSKGRDYIREVEASDLQKELFSDMLESRCPPRGMTDDTFLSGIGSLDQQIQGEYQLQSVVENARAHGYNPKPTDYYMPSMVRPEVGPGDPEAFFSHGCGRSELKQRLERRGLESEGAVTTKAKDIGVDHTAKVHRLHPRIVDRIYNQKVAKDPKLALQDKKDVKQQIAMDHGMD